VGGERRGGLPTQQAQQGVATHRQVPLLAEVPPGRTPQGHTERDEALGEPQGASGPGGRHRGQAFGEDATAAGAIAATPLAHPELEAHTIRCPGQVGQGARIVTVETLRRGGAAWTGHAGLHRAYA
jgi:hypothetical protein